ncbi:triose-phosphate isomerase [candidate division KSB1 bacterium]|nr:triose-phosphate isomerase [candidate division KSB1 bacterium]
MRKRIIAGNWKMNKTLDEAIDLARAIKDKAADVQNVDMILCPPFTNLSSVVDVVKGTSIGVGAQNLHWEAKGAFTGEISADMLRSVGCQYVIIGHSERRQYFGETDETVNKRIKAALAAGLVPIVCVGETLEEREADKTQEVVETQITGAYRDISSNDAENMVVAYEPVWAIGTGKVATPQQAQEVHAYIRSLLKTVYSEKVAETVRIQYGGSMKPGNAAELLANPDVDGGLIGGASLDADSFLGIINA